MNEKKLDLLESLKSLDSIRVHQKAETWEDAIRLATLPLYEKDIVTQKYADDIIESTIKYGPYYIISEQLAMPHASATENSVKGNGFSLITLEKPVLFPNEQEVSVLLCIGAIDGETHTQVAIPQIVAVFEDPESALRIAKMNTVEEIIDYISKIDYTKFLMEE